VCEPDLVPGPGEEKNKKEKNEKEAPRKAEE
jgi:hypothetical protein